MVVELVGLTAAALAVTATIRRLKGFVGEIWTPGRACSAQASDRCDYCIPPPATHAGQFVPGLTALDTSAQILAWALLFGYAQQVFTRLADQQGQNVLNSVRGRTDLKPIPPRRKSYAPAASCRSVGISANHVAAGR